ncbi:MAG TPA: TlpA disulfide reductase family protein [Verrucomicrobiae bacterium]|jgi:thiol-disulfide isomerase/thioredoxin|nr:TlpA disulfide reductase family protein [Verrucomicrobiae bacterium]
MTTICRTIHHFIASAGRLCLLVLLAWCVTAAAQDTPATTTTNISEADKAWGETYKAMQSPLPPKEWNDKKPTEQEAYDFYRPFLLKGVEKAKDFYTRFPDHPKAVSAQKAEYNMIALMVHQFDDTNLAPLLGELQARLLKGTNLSDQERLDFRVDAVQQLLSKLPGAKDDFVKAARALQKDFPDQDVSYQALWIAASLTDVETARGMATEIIAGSAPEGAKEQARGLLKRLDAIGKPMDIQYTAIDGRPVDLAKLKGKVVLVDFWATWCVPCLREMPDVKATYEKLHDKGFEIVGISLDVDKNVLAAFVKENGISWPQYYDGLRWSNKLVMQFGITSVPSMWLVDKQGNVRDQAADISLAEKVSKLLAEQPAAAVLAP